MMSVFFTSKVLVDFTKESSLSNWRIVDDVVMGGRSEGTFFINEQGHGEFKGYVSLENNGGFSSVRYRFQEESLKQYSKVILKVKGDGKKYQFRVKSNRYDYHSYVASFQTNGDWQTIEIDFSEMYPTFRGRRLRMKNFPGKTMEEIAFLIGNKKREQFQLLIDRIELQ